LISILVPTRGRPDNMVRLVRSAFDTSSSSNIEVIFYIDEDDSASVSEAASLKYKYGRVSWIQGPRIVLSQMWNKCAWAALGDILMHCGDDIVFRSNDWNVAVRAEFDKVPDKILLVYGDDGLQGEALATHGFLHKNWVSVLGYFVPPYFSSDYNDTWNTEVAEIIERKVYLPDVITEHMHPAANKGTWDKTHQERLARHAADNVEALYASLAEERQRDARKLKDFIESF
jgi:hypothetical protein